jgi:isopenicillin N synthase-like dioxygenase
MRQIGDQIMPSTPPIPIIDISSFVAGDVAAERAVGRLIGSACREIGFFYITGHAIAPATLARVFSVAAELFRAPAHVKAAAALSGTSGNRGFVRLGGETLDPGRPPDAKEAFNIGLELAADDPELIARKPFRAPNVWPDVADFRSVTLDYFNRMWALGVLLHRAFAHDLGLDPAFFADRFRKPLATLRLLHYPPTQAPLADGQMGAGEHTDYGNVTLLATDSVGGLMVRDRNGRWLEASIIPDAFVCNIGDCLMRWTNDVYVSTPHKVVSPQGLDRYSVAFFLDPDPDAVVACLPTCTGPQRPAKYLPATAAEFLKSRLEPTYRPRTAG